MTSVGRHLWIFLWLSGCETLTESPMALAPEPPSKAAETVASAPLPAESSVSEDIGSRRFWVNPNSEAMKAATRLQSTQPREASWLKELGEQPTAIWFTPQTKDPQADAARWAQAMKGSSTYALAVIQALPKRDCMRYVTPGLDPDTYRVWIEKLVQGFGDTPIYWILEPEALLLTSCLKPEELQDRIQLIAETVLVLKKNPKARVYVDIGYPGWLTVADAVQRLLKAGVLTADGFALNVGQYHRTEDCIAYGQKISEQMGGKAFVVDTSRNGKGVVSRETWCNPKNRAIGEKPQAPTGIKGLDGYLWLKEPGISDGACNGGPPAGVWSEAKAIELMRNAMYPEN